MSEDTKQGIIKIRIKGDSKMLEQLTEEQLAAAKALLKAKFEDDAE